MFTFYPKALLVTTVFVVMFGATVLLAIDVRRGIAAAGILGVLAYVLVEFLVTFNVPWWWRGFGGSRLRVNTFRGEKSRPRA